MTLPHPVFGSFLGLAGRLLMPVGEQQSPTSFAWCGEQRNEPAGSEEEGYRLTRDFVTAMMEHFRRQKTIHKRFAFQILLEVRLGYINLSLGVEIIHPKCSREPLIAELVFNSFNSMMGFLQ